MARSRAESRLRTTAFLYALPGGARAIGAARATLGTVRDWIDARRGVEHPDLTPPRRLAFVGGGDFHATGQEFLGFFRGIGKLAPGDDVLDIGCGCGRMAVPLTGYLDGSSRYEGFDVVPAGIDWCQENITPRFPNFHFQTLDALNERYNPSGSREYGLPYEAETFDFVFATSVFTHLFPDVMENYIAHASRVLRPGGRLFATFFLTNSAKVLPTGSEPILTFAHGGRGYRAVTRQTHEVATGYDEDDVTAKITDAGLTIDDIFYGTWSGGDGLSYQDIVVAGKQPAAG